MDKSAPVFSRSPFWTRHVVECRATEYVQFVLSARLARAKYRMACARFRERNRIDGYVVGKDPAFQRATRKPYLALQAARVAERNALRRLETAVRNCAAASEKI